MEYIEVEGKTVDEALTEALIKLETTSDKIEYEVIEKGSAGLFGLFNTKKAKIRIRKKETIEDAAISFLSDVFQKMGLEVDIQVKADYEERVLNVDLVGSEMGILIGKRGQTLDSLQYLLSLVVNKKSTTHLRVKLDTENYRERRKKTLETLAFNISAKVKRSGRPVKLEPMNPYERRVIHSALQNDRYVTTKSEGEEPNRRVVVILKK